jgi:VCBS repeat-containing protein
VLTLSGMATAASYQAVLRSVTYANSSNNPSTATRTVSFQATDAGALMSSAATRGVTVAGANDAPIVTTTGAPLTYTENAAATAVDTGVTVTDADDANLESATVRLVTGFEPGDVLSFADSSGITGSYAAGVLTLTGSSSVANYQAAMRSVEYEGASDNPVTSKTVEFKANDGTADSAPATRTISVTRVNDAPALDTSNAALAYAEGAGPVAADAGITVTDPDSTQVEGATVQITSNFVVAQDELAFTDQLGITGDYDDATGTLTLSGTAAVASYQAALRAVTYENSSEAPAPPARTLTFTATDLEGATSTPATRDVTLSGTTDPATITTTPGALTYTEGDPARAVDVGLAIADVDDTNLDGATVRLSAGFEPGDVLSFANTPEITGSYVAGVLTLTGSSSVASYQAALRSVEYRHTGDNPAVVKTVEFRADDGDGLGPASTRNIDVTRVNDGPQITTTGANLTYTENDGPVAIDGGLTVTDPDSTQLSGATVAVTTNFQPAQDDLAFVDTADITGSYNDTSGVLTLTGTASVADYQTALRSVTYVNVSEGPAPATRTISFRAADDQSAASNIATRGITITGVNDPPTAVDDTGTTDEDTTLNVPAPGVLANDTDIDPGDTKTVIQLNGSGTLTGTSDSGAAVTINANGSYTYNPGSIFQGLSTGQSDTDSFTYTMADGAGAQSTATVELTINGVSDAPTAVADTFDAIGNTGLFVGTTKPSSDAGKEITGSVLANDTDPDTPPSALAVEPVTNVPTALGGTITIEADGNFTYHPDDGDTGTDTFTYRVCDASPCNVGTVANSTGTLNLAIAGQVWYVRNTAVAGGDGTSDDAFDTLAEAESASGAGDTVYVFDGDNSATNLDTGYLMEPNERLIGEHAGVSLDPDGGGPLGTVPLHAGTAGARPTLTATNEDVVTLASGSTVDGFDVDPAGTGGGIGSGAGAGNVTIANVNLIDGGTFGTQPGLELDGTTGANAISNLTVSTSGATGVRLNNAGTVNFAATGTISITSAGAKGLDASGTNFGSGSVFDAITVTGSDTGGVSLVNTTGTTTFGDLALTTTSGSTPAFNLANAGAVTVQASGTANVNATGGPAVDVTGTNGATLPFDAVSSTNSANDGINLSGLGSGTFSAASGTIAGAAGISFDLDGGNGAVTYPGALNNGSGQTAEITNRGGGAVTLSGPISDTSDAGGGISLSANTSGSTTFSNPSKVINTGTGNAIAMSGSDGHTLTLSGGGLDVDATSGAGIDASTSGTLIVTGAGNTITTTSGRALNVSATDIGTGGLNFQAIASNGATNGINLDTTGATAGLTVTGTGGTCTSAATCTGGAIQGSSGAGIDLTSVGGGVNLTRMSVNNGGDDGISGSSVAGFNLASANVAANGNAVGESGIELTQLSGSASMADSTVSGSADRNVRIANTSGSLSAFDVTNSAFTTTNVTTGDDGFIVENNGTGLMSVSITGSTFTDNKGDHFNASTDASATGSLGVTFSNNTLTTTAGNDPNVVGGGITLSPSGSSDLTFTISGNNIQQAFDEGINLNLGTASTPAASMIGTIANNTVGTAGDVDSGSESGTGINVTSNGAGATTVSVTGNQVRQYANPYGILLNHKEGSSTMNATVTGNTVANPGTFAINGIRADSGATAGDSGTMCVALTGNSVAGSGPGVDTDIRLRQRFNTTIRLPGYGGANNDTTAVNSFVAGSNAGADVSSAHNVGAGGGGFVGGAPCATP